MGENTSVARCYVKSEPEHSAINSDFNLGRVLFRRGIRSRFFQQNRPKATFQELVSRQKLSSPTPDRVNAIMRYHRTMAMMSVQVCSGKIFPDQKAKHANVNYRRKQMTPALW